MQQKLMNSLSSSLVGSFALVLATTACASDTPSRCDSAVQDLAKYRVLSPANAGSANYLESSCPVSWARNYELARFYATGGDFKRSLARLDEIESVDPKLEPRRLALRYWVLYNTFSSRAEMKKVASVALRKFPDNPHSRMLSGVEACLENGCAGALPDLEQSSRELREIRVLPFLSYAFTQEGRPAEAADAFDTFLRNDGANALSDLVVYVGVVAYANVGRLQDARGILALGERAANGASPPNLVKARSVMQQLEAMQEK